MRRIGCLFVPDLPLQALVRGEPELMGAPLAVASGEGARARIDCVSVQARTQGVRPGLPVSDALALAPKLIVRWVPDALIEATRGAALDAAASVSPRMEELAPGVALIDAKGLQQLHGDDRGVAAALIAAASRLGLDASASIASGKALARIAAMGSDGIEVIPKGGERAFLAPLSLAQLGASPKLLETLSRWGIATAGALATLPADGIGSRLGAEGVALHRLACGSDPAPLIPRSPPERFEEVVELDYELAAIEGLLFVLRPALERLVERVSCHALSCRALELRLLLEPVGEAILPVELAAPTREVSTLLSLCRSAIERRPPGAAVRGVRIIAIPAAARHEQLRLFGRPTVAPEKLATALARVAAIVGDDRLGRPSLPDSHLRESFTLSRFDPPSPPDELSFSAEPTRSACISSHNVTKGESLFSADVTEGERSARAGVASLRLFRPPLHAQVQHGPAGPQSLRAGAVTGWVVSCAGPWRLDVGWHEEPVCRDAFDVELSDGAVYRLLRDLRTGQWSVVGRYD